MVFMLIFLVCHLPGVLKAGVPEAEARGGQKRALCYVAISSMITPSSLRHRVLALEQWSQPVGHDPFWGGVTVQIPRMSDICMMILNSSKITVVKQG